ncbi:Uncharacterized protein DAT39_002867 [Clarias magur]|uniref:Uncharacterized protein n=1 Tax=Clarias magur TaxID=1594786 RepID=A0A8J4UVD4_CLAMG|nr:Uncharacterized protein DAT39_002867 [Clarias magur]
MKGLVQRQPSSCIGSFQTRPSIRAGPLLTDSSVLHPFMAPCTLHKSVGDCFERRESSEHCQGSLRATEVIQLKCRMTC